MTPELLSLELSREDFLAELHHLLWIEPHKNKGKQDDGWSCRDHALIVAGIAQMRGCRSNVVSGAAAFVQGKLNGNAPLGRIVKPHSWLSIDGCGTYDLSIRLNGFKEFRHWEDWAVKGLIGSRFEPRTVNYMATRDDATFNNTINAASHLEETRYAIYLNKILIPLDVSHFQNAFKWCNSPLTIRLQKLIKKPKELYPKAILHLIDFLDGKGDSVANLPQIKAWAKIAERSGDALQELCIRGGLQRL
jgi:hypothetical protein